MSSDTNTNIKATALYCPHCKVIHMFDDSDAERRYVKKNHGWICSNCAVPLARMNLHDIAHPAPNAAEPI